MKKYLEVGQIVNTYGIKGFVKVVPFTDNPKRFENLKYIYIVRKNSMEKATIEQVAFAKSNILLKLKEYPDINSAESLKGCFIKIDRQDAVELPEDSYFIVDLIGMEVYSEDGEKIGTLTEVFPTGSNDVYVVKTPEKEILLPAIASVIKQVDIPNKKMIVCLIEGLWNLMY